MRVYLDTKDLINIFEKSYPCNTDQFHNLLRDKGHQLILSFVNIMEISAPLLISQAKTNVMRLLNRIEEMPIKYIARTFRTEMKEAYNAFSEGREYQQVSPFFHRFDETVEDRNDPPTRNFLNFGLAETVFTLWTHDPTLFKGFQGDTKRFQKVVDADRSLTVRPPYRENFVKTIGLLLQSEEIIIPKIELQPFADWIYQVAFRCPAIRLGYEVYHKFIKNVGDMPKEGDIPDFAHIDSVPYVDLITLDRRMSSYVIQASKDFGLGYEGRIFKNAQELLSALN